MKKIILLLLISCSLSSFGQGFLHRDGQNIVDGNGQNVILRGLGLGGWMVQEGYMLQTDAFAGPQHKIKEKITQLIGESNTQEFYQAYRANGITKRDIDSLAAWGFNSVRLPMHYNLYTLPIEDEPVAGENTWLEEGFEMTDNLLAWCAANNLYLILDLHAAPGGQGKDANISDYDSTKPSLWESVDNRNKTIALWRELAERYKDSPWIGAYDLINEPNWNFTGSNQNGCDEQNNGPLRALQMDITEAIREVDNNHLIFIEGNCWGNNYNGMFPLWDDNLALSFHKYWNYNTTASIQGILNLRTQYNVPIWLGESGENSNVWFTEAISLVESNNIGWAFWPMKKIESIAGVTAVTKTADYQTLLNYWQNGGTQPTVAFAKTALMQIAENYKMENVTVKQDVIDAMFRQVQSSETLPYKTHALPGKVYAVNYDLGRINHAYYDTDFVNYRTDTGTFADWNKGWTMRNDGVDIQTCNDTDTNGFQVGFIEPKEWLQYTIDVDELTAYDVDIRYASPSAVAKLYLADANGQISETITLPSTGGYTTWGTATLTDVLLNQGTNKVKIYFEVGNFNLNFIEFKNPTPSAQAAMKVVEASTSILGEKVNVTFNKNLQAGIDFSTSNLQLFVNGTQQNISSIAINPENPRAIVVQPATAINASDVITLSYNGTNILANDATAQPIFTNKPVKNNVGNILGISGKIEAEDFYHNQGMTIETTSDIGGGSALGYTDSGDYLDFLVNISEEGNYKIEYRTSGQNATGKVNLQLIGETTTTYQTVTLNPTGAWTTWATTVSNATLPAGRYMLRINVVDPGFNLNWVRFSIMQPDDDNDGVANVDDDCPDTPAGDVVDFNGCTIFALAYDNFSVKSTSETCRDANNGSIEITANANHPYVATLSGNGINLNNSFTQNTAFANLASGTYTVCITIPTLTEAQHCFEIVIQEPANLAVMARVSNERNSATLDLSGGNLYRIKLNDQLFITDENTFTLNLQVGENAVSVETDKPCQGVYQEKFLMENKIFAYPNPVKDHFLFVNVPAKKDETVFIQVYSMMGKLVINKQFQFDGSAFSIDMSSLSTGTYALKVVSNTSMYNTKIIKQ
ncbi:carbohydrate-binding protein [Flavobacterium soli]|uniref:carbohydrate-binding protein n=1 Tax=Flavobacterium soli TaxID=344881 RepID=UPI00041F8BF2|nr:carbohydrate-binding protein [Flavobacterium soli]